MNQDNTVNVDVKLGVNKFNVDEGHPHIILAEHPDLNESFILILLVAWSAERVEYCAATRSSTNGNIRSEHLALIFATANGFCL